MNREYAKFNQAREDYNPRVLDENHFSNYPDVIIPSEYEEVGGDPIRHELKTLIMKVDTPPPTPPEDEPGVAGCHVFQDRTDHYVAPIYENKAYRRAFATKVILGNLCFYIPSCIFFFMICGWRSAEYELFNHMTEVFWAILASAILGCFYIYFVGLFRNPPALYLGVAFRMLITTGFFGLGTIWLCAAALVQVLHRDSSHDEASEEEEEAAQIEKDFEEDDEADKINSKATSIDALELDHSIPYLGLLTLSIQLVVQIINSVLFIKYKYEVTDYRIPFVIYTVCYTISPILITLALSGMLNNNEETQKGYDVFQVIVGCSLAAWQLMGTPDYLDRLFKGKVCPLKEDETIYAMLHFGM